MFFSAASFLRKRLWDLMINGKWENVCVIEASYGRFYVQQEAHMPSPSNS